jgi:hypothetical protein
LDFSKYEAASIYNSPNLSLFPLLAYHKICNDHYRNEKWQPFEPWTCNIDYLLPTSNMNASSFISVDTFTSLMTSILDLENSNLPIDYFTSVLPRAQYGDESAVSVGLNNADATLIVNDASNPSNGVLFGGSSYGTNDTLVKANAAPTSSHGSYAAQVRTSSTGNSLVGFSGKLTATDSSLKISALLLHDTIIHLINLIGIMISKKTTK